MALKLTPEKQLLLERRLKGFSKGPAPDRTIHKRPCQDSAPLSFAQRQMWLTDQMSPGNPAYNLPVGYRLKGDLNVEALQAGFNHLIKRHEILRTTFPKKGTEPVQAIHPAWELKLDIVSLEHLPADCRDAAAQELSSVESSKSFELTKLPLMRVLLFRLGTDEHLLLINLHHVLSDGLSTVLMLGELDACYRAFCKGISPNLPQLLIQYGDFADWERQELARDGHRDQLEFWREQLKGGLPTLDLPLDKPRPVVQSFKGSNVFFNIPGRLVGALHSLASAQGATFFMVMLAAFQAILHRYSGLNEVILGVPVANPPEMEAQSLIGNFLNMVALRGVLSGDPSFLDLLRRAREAILAAFSNKDVPFEQVVQALRMQRDPARNPVFQAMLQVLSTGAMRLGELEVSPFHFDLAFAQFDLSLHLYERGKGYLGRFEYCSDLFNRDTIERFSNHFLNLLEQVVVDPEQRLSRIGIVRGEEKQRLLVQWNDTAQDYPRDKCVHHLFERAVQQYGNRSAAEFQGQSLTYAELNARSNRLACRLVAAGVKSGDRVGIHVERSLDLVIGLLGILKAGAAYVPLDPAFPSERLAYIIEDAALAAVVVQEDLLSALPYAGGKTIGTDVAWGPLGEGDHKNPAVKLDSSNLAYAIYTSGSTGKPKGVMIEHRAVVNFLLSMQMEPGFGPDDVLVAVTTISFDIAALELFLPLISGGRVVVAGRNESVDGRELLKLLGSAGATVLQATPATWKLMLEAGWNNTPRLKMLCGGEPLSRELANQMLARGRELWNMYGPTETTIWSSARCVEPGDGPVLIGRPIANTQIYIVDKLMSPVPIGVPGELLIGGEGVARGYLNRAELTVERFVANPFTGSGGRVYRTGDLARYRADGSIEFMGRLDFQVKIRGYRIELGEIEHVLTTHSSVRDAVVVARESKTGDAMLVAYIIPARAEGISVDELRAFARAKLPDYMVPYVFVSLEEFPLTPNGKVDRKGFPAPEFSRSKSDEVCIGPSDDLEVQVSAIWRKALRVQRLGIDDNFFEMGGHSLLAAKVFAQMEEKLGIKLPLVVLFQAPSIRKLASVIREGSWQSSWRSLVPISTQGDAPPLFLVHGAEGNVLLYRSLTQKLGHGQPVYGLQSRGLDGSEAVMTEIGEMAENYIREIKSVQPEGPYFLGGYCMGGTIAFEIAQQLKRAGDEVALLALVETYNMCNSPRISLPLMVIHKLQNTCFQFGNFAMVRDGARLEFFRQKLGTELGRAAVLAQAFYSQAAIALSPSFARPSQRLRVRQTNDLAQKTYKPLPYKGKITLFRPRHYFLRFDDPCYGWRPIALDGVQVVELPSFPRAALNEPYVEFVAKTLSRTLETALLETSSTD